MRCVQKACTCRHADTRRHARGHTNSCVFNPQVKGKTRTSPPTYFAQANAKKWFSSPDPTHLQVECQAPAPCWIFHLLPAVLIHSFYTTDVFFVKLIIRICMKLIFFEVPTGRISHCEGSFFCTFSNCKQTHHSVTMAAQNRHRVRLPQQPQHQQERLTSSLSVLRSTKGCLTYETQIIKTTILKTTYG